VSVAALVPARDEEGRVGATVRALLGIPGLEGVVVVDDGSRDGTAREARAAGARVLRLPRPAGKAGAVRAGARWAAAAAPLLLLCDADLGPSARACERLLLPVRYGRTAMAVGRLPPSGVRGGLGGAVGLARWGVRRLTGREVEAPLCGQRALWRHVLDCLGPARGFGLEVALTVDALLAGYSLLELPAPLSHRVTRLDWPGFVHRGGQLRDVALALAQRWPRRRRLREPGFPGWEGRAPWGLG
jgi:glucosyl-3-phosphoglycerate synthase